MSIDQRSIAEGSHFRETVRQTEVAVVYKVGLLHPGILPEHFYDPGETGHNSVDRASSSSSARSNATTGCRRPQQPCAGRD